MNIDGFLCSVWQQLEAVRISREMYAAKLSPEFNCFGYISPNELCLSQIIADLLDPHGNHSQGDKFLSAFLGLIGLGCWTDNKDAQVNKEVTTFNNRRFDIEVKWPNRKLRRSTLFDRKSGILSCIL